jgi:1-deoxy-D-xylulose-5-phosphate reductoisomerase
MTKKKGIAILGSTGSIGTQALEVIEAYPDKFDLQVLTAHSNYELLIHQAIKHQPNSVVIVDESHYQKVKEALWSQDIKVFTGQESLNQIVVSSEIDIVLTALVGYAGLKPTIEAIKAKKTIALANKETLVVAGSLINQLAIKFNVTIYPVDSEHSAIFQCLTGEQGNAIEKIYLTASGGPFRGWDSKALESVTRSQALKHPNWTMGAKITIDSATLMNKGLEVIEAKWLFDLRPDQIDVIVHPQSIIHSLVQFEDGSMKAQMGLPDMKLPIQYAFTYPDRLKTDYPRFNFLDYPQLTFEQADRENFTNLSLAFLAMEKEGTAACALNAANEISVAAFLKDEIRFLDIARINEQVLHECAYVALPSYQDFVEVDAAARILANSLKN